MLTTPDTMRLGFTGVRPLIRRVYRERWVNVFQVIRDIESRGRGSPMTSRAVGIKVHRTGRCMDDQDAFFSTGLNDVIHPVDHRVQPFDSASTPMRIPEVT
jgi:hypothetical protein